MEEKHKGMRREIAEMEAGQSRDYPITKRVVARVYACDLGMGYGRKYSTRTNREQGIVTVTRLE